jgi:hypothetical protein
MPFALVQDVAASWEQYEHFSERLRPEPPPGLIAHVAGPTDEGFRMIDIWASEEHWREFQQRFVASEAAAARQTRRGLDVIHAVLLGGSHVQPFP